ncbi:MAG: sigma-70 family RNA polymerase sigma factor [Peptostreptococcales bacterium]
MMSSEEKLLLKQAIDGDIQSFELLIQKYQRKAYNIAYRYMGNEQDAMDALQDALVKIYKSLKNFREESSFYTWLYTIVSNTCKDELRKRNKLDKITSMTSYADNESGEVLDIKDESNIPEKLLENKEYRQLLLHALNQLTLEHKEVIILRDVQGFSYEEISEILVCTIGTVKSRISRGRQKLREVVTGIMEQN